jgi:5-methylcytosine-specific restriction endonuclease McrA
MDTTLVLTQSYVPHRIVTWQRAVTMLFDDKIEVLASYDVPLRSPSITIAMPAVVRMLSALRPRRKGVKFSRVNVLSRDGYVCQYCGRSAPSRELTFDHVVPRSKGGRTIWENIVTACIRCNERKGARTPHEASMPLRKAPHRPRELPIANLPMHVGRALPEEWRDWLVSS